MKKTTILEFIDLARKEIIKNFGFVRIYLLI